MALDQIVWSIVGKALWDPHPTETDHRAQQLATALGYPLTWRVVRTIETNSDNQSLIVDRIYSGKPGTDCDMWFNHQAAQAAAESWDETTSTPFSYKGGHLLPRQAKFQKGDKVQVLYEGQWYDAKIMKRTQHNEGFKYQVHYDLDRSKQSGVDETYIKHRSDKDPRHEAEALGMPGWEAFSMGNNRWKFVAPDGETYTSKKKAMEAYVASIKASSLAGGDPPWRTTGNEYIGRKVIWATQHKVSARRTVTVEQVGTVTGWISENDVDRSGEPGFVSEQTGKPARLFHVDFEDDPHHPYANLLVESQDLEEYELLECIVLEAEATTTTEPLAKKAKM